MHKRLVAGLSGLVTCLQSNFIGTNFFQTWAFAGFSALLLFLTGCILIGWLQVTWWGQGILPFRGKPKLRSRPPVMVLTLAASQHQVAKILDFSCCFLEQCKFILILSFTERTPHLILWSCIRKSILLISVSQTSLHTGITWRPCGTSVLEDDQRSWKGPTWFLKVVYGEALLASPRSLLEMQKWSHPSVCVFFPSGFSEVPDLGWF